MEKHVFNRLLENLLSLIKNKYLYSPDLYTWRIPIWRQAAEDKAEQSNHSSKEPCCLGAGGGALSPAHMLGLLWEVPPPRMKSQMKGDHHRPFL